MNTNQKEDFINADTLIEFLDRNLSYTLTENGVSKAYHFDLSGNSIQMIHVQKVWNYLQEKIRKLNRENYSMSAELTLQHRLITEYEKIIPKKTQDDIKQWIFSEDDR